MVALAKPQNHYATLWDELLPLEPQLSIAPDTRCQYGDIWQLGNHRFLCGDSTNAQDVQRLLGDERAVLVHADPPYGMGKEKDGIANDNLYGKKLDAFQMQWWRACRPYLSDNASAYIWGNAEDLWRLWYRKLTDSERLTFRNEIVWAKGDAGAGGISHQGVEGLRLYPQETERCLFFMLGEQEMSINADNYWEGWEPIRKYLEQERLKMGWDVPTMKRAVGHSDLSRDHWTSRSQWNFPTREVYEKMQETAHGRAFERDYDTLKRDYDTLKRDYDTLKRDYDTLKRDFLSLRSHFDNTHDLMTDVWQHSRVRGSERYGHPTPKPKALVTRILKSSSPDGSLVYDPFMGSGTTIVSAEQTGRRCYGIEINEQYCDIVLHRWEQITGRKAVKIA